MVEVGFNKGKTKRDRSDKRESERRRDWNWDRGCKKFEFGAGQGGGVANNRANPESRKFSTKKRDRRPAQNDKPGAKYRAGRSGEKPNRGGS
jgi:hypothetical protein